ncbi:MAG: hypothetical protein Q8909_18840, partial [Bacteroidota bacterium]|nr:hypothetical protein [Bacteroidota bacterium]
YLLSFLVFLAIQPEYNADYLLESMDRYVDLVKDKLSYSDIIITATGATRCYTNLRFALNKLRNFGLVHHTTRIDHSIKRSLLPTPFGYLVAAYVSHFKEADVQNLLDNKITKSSPNFYNLVVQFKRDTVGFIDQVTLKTENIELVELVDPIRESFKAIASNIKFSESYNSEDIEKTELKMKEFYRNDENQQSISLEMNRLIVSR